MDCAVYALHKIQGEQMKNLARLTFQQQFQQKLQTTFMCI